MDFASFIRSLIFAYLENNKGKRRLKQHYNSSHNILLVGEGDFSFSVCLAYDFGSAKNMVATTLDSREMLMRKYAEAKYNIEKLVEMGCTVIYEVDATTMASHPFLCNCQFDRIIYNFPHAGFFGKENDKFQLSLHRKLLKGFFRSAYKILRICGQVHVTHKNGKPYNKWGLEELALKGSLYLLEEVPFISSDFPGYENKRGSGRNCDDSFDIRCSSIFKFGTALFACVLATMKEMSIQNDVDCDVDSGRITNSHIDVEEIADRYLERWERKPKKLKARKARGFAGRVRSREHMCYRANGASPEFVGLYY